MSTGEKAFGLPKSILLATERFDALDAKIRGVAANQASRARSHAGLAQRVAEIEGYLKAATGTPFAGQPRIDRS